MAYIAMAYMAMAYVVGPGSIVELPAAKPPDPLRVMWHAAQHPCLHSCIRSSRTTEDATAHGMRGMSCGVPVTCNRSWVGR